MKLDKFKLIREQYIAEELLEADNEELFEFFEKKYSDEMLNEGIIRGFINWFKRNFSPKASELRDLGDQYYDWLMDEYKAEYRDGKDESKLEKFLRREDISVDIKDKIIQIAGDDKVYQDLANKILLEKRLQAKKDFSHSVLGEDSNLAKQYGDEYKDAARKTSDAVNKLSKEAAWDLHKKVKTLRDTIKKKDFSNAEIAKTLATGISTFYVIRHVDTMSYSADKMYSEFEKAEGELKIENREMAQICKGIRSFRGKKELEKSTFSISDINSYLDDAREDLEATGVKLGEDLAELAKNGYFRFYIALSNPDDRLTFVKRLKDYVEENDETTVNNESEKLNSIVDEAYSKGAVKLDTVMKRELSNFVKNVKKKEKDKEGSTEKATEKDKEGSTEKATEKDKDEYPLTDKLKEKIRSSDNISKIIEGVILVVSSTEKTENGYVMSERVESQMGKMFDDLGFQNVFNTDEKNRLKNKSIDEKMIATAKEYLDGGLSPTNLIETKFKKTDIDQAVEGLKADLQSIVEIYKSGIEKAKSTDREGLFSASNIARFFLSKNLSKDKTEEKQIEEKFSNIVEKAGIEK